MRVGVVGMGHVGQTLVEYLRHCRMRIEVITFDPRFDDRYPDLDLGSCDFVCVCVGTPMSADGSCDLSAVTEAVTRLPCNRVLLRSTVTPGTTDRLRADTEKIVCHWPEFYGEGDHTGMARPERMVEMTYAILGGSDADRNELVELLTPIMGAQPIWHLCTAIESELIKYMENCYLAMKVTFVNEFYDICSAFGANWNSVRHGWLLDPRVGRSHSAVFHPRSRFRRGLPPKGSSRDDPRC
jgi:UDPglucose 6-dehydrogenase